MQNKTKGNVITFIRKPTANRKLFYIIPMCTITVKNGISMLDIIRKGTESNTVRIIMSLYKPMMYPPLKYSAKFWTAHLRKVANRKVAEKGNWNGLEIGAPS